MHYLLIDIYHVYVKFVSTLKVKDLSKLYNTMPITNSLYHPTSFCTVQHNEKVEHFGILNSYELLRLCSSNTLKKIFCSQLRALVGPHWGQRAYTLHITNLSTSNISFLH